MTRVSSIRKQFKKTEAILITSLPDIYYFTGFTGSSGALIITSKHAIFFTDFRYKEQSAKEVRDAEIVIIKDSLYEEFARHPVLQDVETVRFAPSVEYSLYTLLKETTKGRKLIPYKDEIAKLRMIKVEAEIKTIKMAAKIADSVFDSMLSLIKPGVAEKDIAIEFEYQAKKRGADGISFPTIVASGPNAALPHASVGSRKIRSGDTVTLDFGVMYHRYCSDCTRTLIFGHNSKAEKIYQIVLNAQQSAIKAVRTGISFKKLDSIARDIIARNGYGEYFGHSLGHGVGLNVHEAPRVSGKNEEKVMPGMIFTIEPGIYLPNFGGIRIEDMVLVKDKEVEVLTKASYCK